LRPKTQMDPLPHYPEYGGQFQYFKVPNHDKSSDCQECDPGKVTSKIDKAQTRS